MIITCSNDEKIKLWSAELDPIETLLGHTAFVFAVKALKLGRYISGGEDRVLKFWEESSTIQDFPLPCSVWSLSFD
jgi:WD40 repeat protein